MSLDFNIDSSDPRHLLRVGINPGKLSKKDRNIQIKESGSVIKLPYVDSSNTIKVDKPRWYKRLFVQKHYPKLSAQNLNYVWIENKKTNQSYRVNKQALAAELGVKTEDIHKHLIKAKGSGGAILDQKYIEKRLKKLHHSACIIQKSYEEMSKNLNASQPVENLIQKTEKKLKRAVGNDLKHKGIIDNINAEMREADPHSTEAFLNVVNRHTWWQIPGANENERADEESDTQLDTEPEAEEVEDEPKAQPVAQTEDQAGPSSSKSTHAESSVPRAGTYAKASASTESTKARYKDNPQLREQKNLEKAIKEHTLPEERQVILDLVREPRAKDQIPSEFTCHAHSDKGLREEQEDAHLTVVIPQGQLIAIFDGNSGISKKGKEVAQFAADNLSQEFGKQLNAHPNDIPTVMKNSVLALDTQIQEHDEMNDSGATACIGYIDQNSILHVGTLGDTEIKVFRKVDGQIYCIPLSCVRNFGSTKDEKRFVRHYKEIFMSPERFEDLDEREQAENNLEMRARELEYWKSLSPKKRRFPFYGENFKGDGVNLSRTLGIKDEKENGNVIVTNPKTAALALQKGDLVLNACDGLWDFVDDAAFIKDVLEPNWSNPEALPEATTQYALAKGSRDNISAVVLKCS